MPRKKRKWSKLAVAKTEQKWVTCYNKIMEENMEKVLENTELINWAKSLCEGKPLWQLIVAQTLGFDNVGKERIIKEIADKCNKQVNAFEFQRVNQAVIEFVRGTELEDVVLSYLTEAVAADKGIAVVKVYRHETPTTAKVGEYYIRPFIEMPHSGEPRKAIQQRLFDRIFRNATLSEYDGGHFCRINYITTLTENEYEYLREISAGKVGA